METVCSQILSEKEILPGSGITQQSGYINNCKVLIK